MSCSLHEQLRWTELFLSNVTGTNLICSWGMAGNEDRKCAGHWREDMLEPDPYL